MNDTDRLKRIEYIFVNNTIEKIKHDTALAARLKRADNESMEYQAFEHLARYNIDFEIVNLRKAYCLISATIAKNKVSRNGSESIGKVLALCYDKDNEQAKARLYRLLACNNVDDVCAVLRPMLSLVGSRGFAERLDYAALLQDILYINGDKTKTRWAKAFFMKPDKDEVQNDINNPHA